MNADIIYFLIAFIIHEIGHYVSFLYYGIKPSVNFHWFGVSIGDDEYFDLTVRQMIVCSLSGIIFGGVIILCFVSNLEFYFLSYMILCSMDISNIIQLLSSKKEYRNMVGLDYQEKMLNDEREKRECKVKDV